MATTSSPPRNHALKRKAIDDHSSADIDRRSPKKNKLTYVSVFTEFLRVVEVCHFLGWVINENLWVVSL